MIRIWGLSLRKTRDCTLRGVAILELLRKVWIDCSLGICEAMADSINSRCFITFYPIWLFKSSICSWVTGISRCDFNYNNVFCFIFISLRSLYSSARSYSGLFVDFPTLSGILVDDLTWLSCVFNFLITSFNFFSLLSKNSFFSWLS